MRTPLPTTHKWTGLNLRIARKQLYLAVSRRSEALSNKLKAATTETDSTFAKVSASGFTRPERRNNRENMERMMHQSGDSLDATIRFRGVAGFAPIELRGRGPNPTPSRVGRAP